MYFRWPEIPDTESAHFHYSGSTIHEDGRIVEDIIHRIKPEWLRRCL